MAEQSRRKRRLVRHEAPAPTAEPPKKQRRRRRCIRRDVQEQAEQTPPRIDCEGGTVVLSDAERSVPADGTKATWTAPEDMPDWQAKLVVQGLMCGARLTYGRGYCRCRQVIRGGDSRPPFRCRIHGGRMAIGIQTANGDAAIKRGAYSSFLRPGEEETWDRIKSNSLEEELRLLRLRLARALEWEQEWEERLEADPQSLMRVTEKIVKSGGMDAGVTLKKSVPDARRVVEDCIRAIRQLEAIKAESMRLGYYDDGIAEDGGGSQGVHVYLPDNSRAPSSQPPSFGSPLPQEAQA